jgi:hypothetical protein
MARSPFQTRRTVSEQFTRPLQRRRRRQLLRQEEVQRSLQPRFLCDRRGNPGQYEYRMVLIDWRTIWLTREVVSGIALMVDPKWDDHMEAVDAWVDSGRRIPFADWAREHEHYIDDDH